MSRRIAPALATSSDVLHLIRTGEAVTRSDIGRVTESHSRTGMMDPACPGRP